MSELLEERLTLSPLSSCWVFFVVVVVVLSFVSVLFWGFFGGIYLFVFLRPYPQHMEVLRLGVKLEL